MLSAKKKTSSSHSNYNCSIKVGSGGFLSLFSLIV